MHLRTAFVLLLASLAFAAEQGDVGVPGESRPALARLEAARKAIREKDWDEAIAVLTSLVATGGDDMIALGEGRQTQARLVAQLALTRLPKSALQKYRHQAEPQAKRWLEQGLKERDSALLHQVVKQAFCTRSALTALDRLGDQAFERGRFGEAEIWWQAIAPLTGNEDAEGLVYPDPPAEVAVRAKAKQLLARLFAERSSFRSDLAAFRKVHPKAQGQLAGRKGTYADLLQAVAEERAKRTIPQAGDWLSFAGNSSRQTVLPAGERFLDHLSGLARSGPAWRFDLGRRERFGIGFKEARADKVIDAARRLAFHPVVVGDLALVADARYITAYDLRTGKGATWFDLEDQVGGVNVTVTTPTIPDLRYTLTVADDAVFARLGSQAIRDVRPDPRTRKPATSGESVLVSLSLEGKKRWMVRAIDPGRKEYSVFEGAPLVTAGLVYIAASRFEGDKLITAIHCYPAHPEDTAPLPLWRTDICETRELLPAGGEDITLQRRHRHHLLTLAGPNLVYCSHSGAIVALDAGTGRRTWALKYPRREVTQPEDEPVLRDLAPCVFADGRIYVAPADSEKLFCLDPLTGTILWQREGLEVVHLLGVGQGRLIFTTYRNPRQGRLHAGGLRAVRASDGSDESGWQLPDDGGGLAPMGRGLLVGDLVLWPTARQPCGVIAVRQEDGRQPDNPTLLHNIPAGNLVWANGHLLVTDQKTMWAFVPSEKLPDEDEKDVRLAPEKLLRPARAAAARQEHQKAIERYEAVSKSPAAPVLIRHEARQQVRDVMVDAARTALHKDKKDETVRWLSAAVKDTSGRARLETLTRAAEMWTHAKVWPEALRAWQAVLASGEATVRGERGLPQRAGIVAMQRIAEIRKQKPEAIAPVANELKDELTKLGDERNEAFVRLIRRYPNFIARALRAEASAAAKARRWTDAARWSGWELASTLRSEARLEALSGIAEAWENLGCPQAARSAWLRLAQLDPSRRADVAERLKTPPFQPQSTTKVLTVPLRSVQSLTLAEEEDFIAPTQVEGLVAELLFSHDKGKDELVSRSRQTGEIRWRSALGFTPSWLAGLGHLAIVAGKGGIATFDATTGEQIWEFAAPQLVTYQREEPSPAELTRFHLIGLHLVFVLNGDTLLGMDVFSGEVLWRQRPIDAGLGLPEPYGRVHHLLPLGEDRLFAQVSGRRWLIDISSGKVQVERPEGIAAWLREPVLLPKGDVLLVPDSQSVERLDPVTMKPRWTYRPPGKTTRTNGPPLLVANSDRLAVIVPMNLGLRLVRLEPETGKERWSRLVEGDPDSLDQEGWQIDGDRLYHAEGGRLRAWALADGKPLWTRTLPGDRTWRLHLSGMALLASPGRAKVPAFQFRWPGGALQWQLGPWPDHGPVWPLWCLDLTTGEPVQRLNLSASPTSSSMPTGDGLIPECEAGLVEVAGPVVWWDKTGLIFVTARCVRVLDREPAQAGK